MSNYQQRPKQLTASHLMLYIILTVYIVVALFGIVSCTACLKAEDYSTCGTILIALFSYTAVCGTSTIVMYVNKAAKENEIKINNDKYRMKLEIAKEIYRLFSNKTLDEKSLMFIKILSEEQDLNSYIQTSPPESNDDNLG